MRKGIFALEALDESVEAERKAAEERATPEALADAEVEADAAKIEVEAGEIEADAAQIEEAEEVRDTVDGLADRVEASTTAEVDAEGEAIPEEDRGISDETAETLEVAVEHFRNRLGFKKKVMPALEGFKVAGKRKQVSMEALANLRDLSARTDATIGIAQEGLFARIKNAVERTFTSNEKIVKSIKALAGKEVPAEHEIKDPAWGRVFARSGSAELTSADILAYLKKVSDGRKKTIPILEKFTEIAKKASVEVDKGRFIASDEGTKALLELIKDADAVKAEFDKEFHAGTGSEKAVNVKSVSAQDFKKISAIVESLADDSAYERTVENFVGAVMEADSEAGLNAALRLGKGMATDIRAYRKLCRSGLQKVWAGVYEIGNIEQKAIYSAYKYLAVSVGTKAAE